MINTGISFYNNVPDQIKLREVPTMEITANGYTPHCPEI
jgi:hypothetical protein